MSQKQKNKKRRRRPLWCNDSKTCPSSRSTLIQLHMFSIIWIINRHWFSRCHVPPGYTASHSIRQQFSCFIAMRTQNCNNHIHDKKTHALDTITPSSIFTPDSCKINMYEVSQYCNYSNSFLINTFFSHWFWRVMSYRQQCYIKW